MPDDSHETSCFIFFRKLGNMSKYLSSAAVMIVKWDSVPFLGTQPRCMIMG